MNGDFLCPFDQIGTGTTECVTVERYFWKIEIEVLKFENTFDYSLHSNSVFKQKNVLPLYNTCIFILWSMNNFFVTNYPVN